MKKILKIQLLFLCLILAFFSCEKSKKEKLVDAFEQYVNGLSLAELEKFDIFKKGNVESIDGDPLNDSYYYEFESEYFNPVDWFSDVDLQALKIAEEELKGRPIYMNSAKDFCEFEHERRLVSRGITDNVNDTIEQSVYFDATYIKSWLADVKDKYPNTTPSGFRAYFAGYPNYIINAKGDTIIEKNRSTIVLRAMYLKQQAGKPDSILKIPFILRDTGSGRDILTYDLGGLCPPNCHDDPEIE